MFDVKSFDIAKFDSILAKGLSNGLGEVGGQMCIEAAICSTLGLPHGDDPKCVADSVRAFKIALNDSSWSSPQARAKGLRNLGLAQLGSLGIVSDEEFATKLSGKTIRVLLPKLFRELFPNDSKMLEVAAKCERDGDAAAAQEAQEDSYLILAADLALEVLTELKSPGVALL